MPRQKDLKRLVRTRMKKTGEAYTTARAHIIRKNAPARTMPPDPAPDYAALAGMSDSAIKAKTGCGWSKWVRTLDYHKAYELSHREIAALVHEKYSVPAWWTQAVTVGYERIKGLRERGQRRSGGYEASKSRTFHVPVAALFGAWKSPAKRKRFLDGSPVRVRTASSPRSMRLEMEDGSIVALWFTSKGDRKSAVAVQHLNLPDKATAEQRKQYWSERLDSLGMMLAR